MNWQEAIQEATENGYKAGIREGVRRAYEYMKDQHRIAGYDLDHAVSFLELKYGDSGVIDKGVDA